MKIEDFKIYTSDFLYLVCIENDLTNDLEDHNRSTLLDCINTLLIINNNNIKMPFHILKKHYNYYWRTNDRYLKLNYPDNKQSNFSFIN